MAEMAEVKAGMERRHKRDKRKKLEQKKKARVRAAQAVLGGSLTPRPLLPPETHSGTCVPLAALSLSAALHRSLDIQLTGGTNISSRFDCQLSLNCWQAPSRKAKYSVNFYQI